MAALRDVPAVRVDAIRALAQFHAHAKPAMPTLLRLAAHPEERTRSAAVRAISWIDPASPPSIRVFVRALNETKLASAALTGLRLAGDAARDAVPAVMAFLKRQTNPYPHILAEGMRVLGGAGRGHAEVVPFLQRYLSHPTEGVSKEAATALGRLGAAAREAIPALEALAKDSVAEIAAAALAAVASINKALEEADKGDETPHSEQETGSTTDREAED